MPGNKNMKGYFNHIEKETAENLDFRRVLYTAKHSQLVVMNLRPSEEIGSEVHTVDQFFRFERGTGMVVIDGNEYAVTDGDAIIVPAGSTHNVINMSATEPLKLYSIYSPPQHVDGTVHPTKADETEEHFNGKTTE